jgi:hypothetical protein
LHEGDEVNRVEDGNALLAGEALLPYRRRSGHKRTALMRLLTSIPSSRPRLAQRHELRGEVTQLGGLGNDAQAG